MLYERYPKLNSCKKEIEKALELLIDTYKNGGKVLVCGNGGSASDSEHIVGELMKGFKGFKHTLIKTVHITIILHRFLRFSFQRHQLISLMQGSVVVQLG